MRQPYRIRGNLETSHTHGNRHGGVGDQFIRGDIGTVLSSNTDTYTATVRTSDGRILENLGRMRSSPGDIAALETGTEVLINYDYGAPFIMGILTIPAGEPTDTERYSATDLQGFGGQGLNKNTGDVGANFRLASEPDDLIPGDHVKIGPEGNMVGVLAGGMNVMKSSALSQIKTHSLNDLVEIISRNFRSVTDMGEQTIKNDEGRINWRFRGGSDQLTESGPDEENWTIRFDLGSEGDILNFELTTPKGQTLFKLHVDSDGKCEIFGVNGVSINSGSQNGTTSAEENTGNKIRYVGGDQTETIRGSHSVTVRNSQEITVLNDLATSAGNDLRSQALRDHALSAGRSMYVSVQGSLFGDAMVYDIVSGDWVVNIGSPISPNPVSGFEMNTFAGNMAFGSLAGGNFTVTSLLGNLETTTKKAIISTNLIPDSVVLGGTVLSSHIVKYEQLEAHLSTLYSLLDSHTHTIAGTATAAGIPVTGTTFTPVIPFSPLLTPSIITMKSITTGVSL